LNFFYDILEIPVAMADADADTKALNEKYENGNVTIDDVFQHWNASYSCSKKNDHVYLSGRMYELRCTYMILTKVTLRIIVESYNCRCRNGCRCNEDDNDSDAFDTKTYSNSQDDAYTWDQLEEAIQNWDIDIDVPWGLLGAFFQAYDKSVWPDPSKEAIDEYCKLFMP
jgi:hypothetical protein